MPPLEGMGSTIRQLEHLCRDDVEALTAIREAKKTKGGHGNKLTTNSSRNTIQGTTKAYTAARLEREAPELYEQVKSGRLSANAAAIQAGFRKKTWTAPEPSEYRAAIEQALKPSLKRPPCAPAPS